MTVENASTIQILTRESDDLSRSGRLELVTQAMPVSELRKRFKEFVSNLQGMIDDETLENSPFQLNEVQFSVEITADGEFKLMGTGVGVQAGSAVTFKLSRKS